MSKNKRQPYIFVTQQKLMDFCRYDIGWLDIVGGNEDDAYPENGFDVQCEVDYPFQLEDLKTALTHFREEDILLDDFLFDWWFPLMMYFYVNLCLDDLMGPDSSMIDEADLPVLPMSDEDVIVTVLTVFARSDLDKKLSSDAGALSKYIDLEGLYNMIELYQEDKDRPLTERRYTIQQKTVFINHWDNGVLLADAPDDIKTLFIKFTDELCELNIFDGLRAKAYGCYGGNAVYECDFKESARLLEILWRKFSFGYAANTLGYIHYYGRIDGKPDYERAFFYFSVASNFNIVEAKYKLADMFLKGLYVAPNPVLANQTYMKLYDETRFYFENGDYACDFADVALRTGSALMSIPPFKLRGYKILLEAKYAIDKRIEHAYEYGDNEVADRISKTLAAAKIQLKQDGDVNISSRWRTLDRPDSTEPLEEFSNVARDSNYYLKVKKSGKDKIQFTIVRESATPNAKARLSLSSQPWHDFCGMVSKIQFCISSEHSNSFINSLIKSKVKRVNFDRLEVEAPTDNILGIMSFRFYDRGELVCFVVTDRIFYNKPKDESECPD